MGELMSVLDLLRATAGTDQALTVICDSQYVINCCTRWMSGWKKRGWRKADNKPVLNVDLLKQIDEALAGRRVTFQWVKGHAGHPLNEKADDLARAAATAYRDGTPVRTGPGFASSRGAEGTIEGPSSGAASRADVNGDEDRGTVQDVDTTVVPESDAPAEADGYVPLTPLSPDPIRHAQPDLFSMVDEPASSAHGQGSREHVARERAARGQEVRDQPVRDQVVRDRTQRDQTAHDQPVRDQATRDQATRDQALRDQAETALIVTITELTRELMADDTQLDRERLAELMHPDFVAHLPGGLIRTKGSIMARPAALSGAVQMDIVGADRLGDDLILLRHRMRRNSQEYLCAIMWQRVGRAWQARFQQLTPTA